MNKFQHEATLWILFFFLLFSLVQAFYSSKFPWCRLPELEEKKNHVCLHIYLPICLRLTSRPLCHLQVSVTPASMVNVRDFLISVNLGLIFGVSWCILGAGGNDYLSPFSGLCCMMGTLRLWWHCLLFSCVEVFGNSFYVNQNSQVVWGICCIY